VTSTIIATVGVRGTLLAMMSTRSVIAFVVTAGIYSTTDGTGVTACSLVARAVGLEVVFETDTL